MRKYYFWSDLSYKKMPKHIKLFTFFDLNEMAWK